MASGRNVGAGALRTQAAAAPARADDDTSGRLDISAQVLVARFDRILDRISQQISQILANLRGLCLGCIEADFCNQILILQHFSRSTRVINLCTLQTQFFADFGNSFSNFCQIIIEKMFKFRSENV